MRPLLVFLLLLTSCSHQGHRRPCVSHPRVIYPGILIVLDAGHGGHDPGTISLDKKTEEKDLALTTTLLTAAHLREMGYRVQLTRRDDTFVPLKERATIANEAGATLFVSIHYNGAKNTAAEGVEVYTWRAPAENRREIQSKKLADALLTRILRYTDAPSRGLKRANYVVLRETDMPAALVESGFVTNKEELARLKDPTYINCISWGIAQGINDYLLQ